MTHARISTKPVGSRLRRRAVAIASGLSLLLVATIAWHLTSLRGLPDIGDPFDVAAFSNVSIRDEDNAFVLYRQATAQYVELQGDPILDWPKAPEPTRRWLAHNRRALEIWRRGTKRTDALFAPPAEMSFETNQDDLHKLFFLSRLACLEGSRLEFEGDLSGAWTWYRAVLRASRHVIQHADLMLRLYGVAWHKLAADRLSVWAKQPRLDPALLRNALAEVQTIDRMTVPPSEFLKAEYITFTNSLGLPHMPESLIELLVREQNSSWPRGKSLVYRLAAPFWREPERSRLVFRLLIANVLAFCDRPPGERPPLVVGDPFIFQDTEGASRSGRSLSPERLHDWYESTLFLKVEVPVLAQVLKTIDKERSLQAEVVIDLASELYARDHGSPPATPEALVGPYLKVLPKAD